MSEPVARLIEHHGDRRGDGARSHVLGLGVHVLGRLAGVDLVLDHADVSRRHAELEITPEGAWIRDLGSKNGLRVDGRRVTEAALEDGAQIGFGELRLTFEHPGARVDRLLQRSGEPTVRRPRGPDLASDPASASAAPRRAPSVLAPALAALAFALLLTLLLVFG